MKPAHIALLNTNNGVTMVDLKVKTDELEKMKAEVEIMKKEHKEEFNKLKADMSRLSNQLEAMNKNNAKQNEIGQR